MVQSHATARRLRYVVLPVIGSTAREGHEPTLVGVKFQFVQICPLLGTHLDRSSHFAYPTAENHCYAHGRVSPLTIEEQQKLCLGPAYAECRFYKAHHARSIAAEKSRSPKAVRPQLRHASGAQRAALLGTLLLLVFMVGLWLLQAGLPQGGVPAPGPSPTPTRTSTATPTATPRSATLTPRPPTSTATASNTPIPTATPVIYVVQPGDVLVAIAARFGVSVQAIMEANNLSDPRLLRDGTRLVIPRATPAGASPRSTATR